MSQRSPLTPLVVLEAVVLDTETTGLDAGTARLVQIGAVRVGEGAVQATSRIDQLIDPGIPIPPETTRVHGISDRMVQGSPRFSEAEPALRGFLGASIVIGHTIAFDTAVLDAECARAGVPPLRLQTMDVRSLAEIALPGLAQYDLDRIAAALGITVEGRHTAIGDAMTTARIYIALLVPLRQRGIRTLADIDLALRNLADRQISAGRSVGSANAATVDRTQALVRIDSFPYRHLVQDVMSAPAVWGEPGISVGAALRQLIERKISSLLVNDAVGRTGIATERDLIRALDRHGPAALGMPVASFATQPLQAVPADAFVYRAIGRMERLGIRHLPVSGPDGEIVGMVTTRNLLRHRATTAIALGDEIDAATSAAALAAAWAKLATVARALVDEDVDPRVVASVVSTEVCAMTRRAAELAEARMAELGQGAPPCAYTVLVLGSAGRGESLLAADQDNAIIFQSGAADGPEDRWFEKLAAAMNEFLDVAGVPLCKGGVMARNAAWRQSEEAWRAAASQWVRRQRPEDLLNVDIFFDAVPVHGDTAMGDRVLAHAFEIARRARDFQMQLTELARNWSAPLTVFGNLKLDADKRIDLKKHGILPIFTAARVMAIKAGIRVRGTPARLHATCEGERQRDDVETLTGAHRLILKAMLEQQLADIEAGRAPGPRVAIDRLPAEARKDLKAAIRNVGLAAALVGEGRI